ncbi:MAG: hypothetical protein ACOH1Q_10825 [Thiobacillus sp.]
MIEDIVELVSYAAADIAIDKAAKKRRWVKVVKYVGALLFLVLIASAIYVTVRYS